MKRVLQPDHVEHVFTKSSDPDYFTFAVVRHPFDRILSAYRDRIVRDGCTWQAKEQVPRLYGKLHLG